MTKFYSVGPDELGEWDFQNFGKELDNYEWAVYYYESGYYEGSGEIVAFHKESGKLETESLSHCSCYGPIDGGMSGASRTPEQYFASRESVFDPYDKPEVFEMVKRLLAGEEVQPSLVLTWADVDPKQKKD